MTLTYRMSFSTGGLFINESLAVARLYEDLADWDLVKAEALKSKTLQFRTQSSAKRSIREIVHRLRAFAEDEFVLFLTAARQDQGYLLWLAVCRTYPFVAEFAAELVSDRFLSFRTDLTYDDFDTFFEAKSEWHDELAEISVSTRSKVRQILFRMLREAGIISKDDSILGAMLSPQLLELICEHDRSELRFFPGAELSGRSSC